MNEKEDMFEEDGFQEASSSLVKWDETAIGKVYAGVLETYKQVVIDGNPANIYTIRTKSGEVAFAAPQLLNDQLQKHAMGTIVRFSYVGVKPGKKYKVFNFQFAKPTPANLKAVGLEPEVETFSEKVTTDGEL